MDINKYLVDETYHSKIENSSFDDNPYKISDEEIKDRSK